MKPDLMNPEQVAAARAIFDAAMRALRRPVDVDGDAAGEVLALIGGQGTGKTEVLLSVGRMLVAAREQEAAERRNAQREAQARQQAHRDQQLAALARMAQAAKPAPPQPRSEGVDFEADDTPAPPPRPRPPTAAELRARAKAEKEAAEFEAMERFEVSFADEEEQW